MQYTKYYQSLMRAVGRLKEESKEEQIPDSDDSELRLDSILHGIINQLFC